MVNKRVSCPHCASLRTKKKGKQGKRQRYGCNECEKRFQLKRPETKVTHEIWNAYTRGKQTLKELSREYQKSHVWVCKQLDMIKAPLPDIKPQKTVIVPDTTFWGR